jgi:hypothetical protein
VGYLSPPPSPQPVVVYKDVGGLVSDYEARTEGYRRENREVRLHECRSACTLALSLPNVCVYPDAKLKFHQAYNELTREADLGVSTRLFDSYPAAVRGRLGYLTRQYKVLSGVELIALGVRDCARGDRVMVAAKKPQAAPVMTASPNPSPNPLREIAQNVQVAVANALARPADAQAESTTIAITDRNPLPPALARLSGDAEARAGRSAELIPLPPRRPDMSFMSAAASTAQSSHLIAGAQPILDASRFAPGAYSPRADVELSKDEKFGG